MKNVWKIIEMFGGMDALEEDYIRLPGRSSAMMPLIIESISEGPRGYPQVSVCHTYIQNGDVMRDPEMVFEIKDDPAMPENWMPVMYQQDNLGLYQEAVYARDGHVYMNDKLVRSLKSFAATWDKNIGDHGYIEIAEKMLAELPIPAKQTHGPDAYFDETPLGIMLDDNPIDE